jgi:hypothetical protein
MYPKSHQYEVITIRKCQLKQSNSEKTAFQNILLVSRGQGRAASTVDTREEL